MLLADVNVLVHAHREDAADHLAHRAWLERCLSADEPFGVSELALSAFLRIVTNRRVFRAPTPMARALDFATEVLTGPASVPLRSGPKHWALFSRLCSDPGVRGNLVPDAYLAALALEHGATLVTHDRGFARFPGLRWEAPST